MTQPTPSERQPGSQPTAQELAKELDAIALKRKRLRRKRMAVLVLVVVGLLFWYATPGRADDTTGTDGGFWQNVLSFWWNWLLSTMLDMANSLMGAIVNNMPSGWQANISGIAPYVSLANAWVPIDLGLVLLGLYYTFLGVFVAVKFILKLIPGIG